MSYNAGEVLAENPQVDYILSGEGERSVPCLLYTSVVETMGERGMGSVLKHFPGYGNNADTHTGIAVDDRPYDSFAASDFLPFRAGIEAGAVSYTHLARGDRAGKRRDRQGRA